MSYYAERNGWVDNGKPLNPKNTRCPNCGGNNYKETLSREYCPDCGLECDYWGNGTNPVYENMMTRNARIEEERREAEFKRYYEEQYGEPYDD